MVKKFFVKSSTQAIALKTMDNHGVPANIQRSIQNDILKQQLWLPGYTALKSGLVNNVSEAVFWNLSLYALACRNPGHDNMLYEVFLDAAVRSLTEVGYSTPEIQVLALLVENTVDERNIPDFAAVA